jgi:hypothetical protein
LFDRQRQWIDDLLRLVRERSETQTKIEDRAGTDRAAAEKDIKAARQGLKNRRDRALQAAEEVFQRTQRSVMERAAADTKANDDDLAKSRFRIAKEMDDTEEKLRDALQDRGWQATSVFDAAEKDAKGEMQKYKQRATEVVARAQQIWHESEQWLGDRGVAIDDVLSHKPATLTTATVGETQAATDANLQAADDLFARMKRLIAPKLLPLPVGIAMFVVFEVLFCLPAAFVSSLPPSIQAPPLLYLIGGIFAGGALFALTRAMIKMVGTRQMLTKGEKVARLLDKAEAGAARLRDQAQADYDKAVAELKDKHVRDQRAAQNEYQPRITAIVERRAYLHSELNERHQSTVKAVQKKRDDDMHAAEEKNWATRAEAEEQYERDLASAEQSHKDRLEEIQRNYDQGWRDLTNKWQSELQRLRTEHADLRETNELLFPAWDAPAWDDRPMVTEVARGLRLGDQPFDLAAVKDGIPSDARLKVETPVKGDLPAFMPFPHTGGLLLKARDNGRAKAVQVLQVEMMRFLTALPPGKVRFTIIDPVGLGDNFAAFMHLADYDELLVTSRIWTEPAQIEQRLTDLSGHMENVIQKYLRHQFKSIEEYNAAAGEVAEPYRVLVVANFPVNFSGEAARRLVSIINSGASCGVFALVSVDLRQPVPHGFDLADLEAGSHTMVWKDTRFVFKDELLNTFGLNLDNPPDARKTSALVHRIGAQAKTAARVEVPFDFVAPSDDKVWTGDSRKGVIVPIGRSGATKRQALDLGKGTAQHGLIAGKTGSGKSTLLHAIITNLGLTYSPDEVELYLIDFKKGVEFKPYAEYAMPHARVVAIESEREFGLSVLQRLDNELKTRGDKFREAGVTDINGYRTERPAEKMPRILLIVDEFQEFFVEEDKLAQEAALLLDRLVRQGRAFGLHVLLGSQTLGGAYSLARATIDQMAVRIALQCSEADAHLILSKENSAARLLSRPGEAIYNDANGLVEGNDVFQVVWLPEERRESALKLMDQRAKVIAGRQPPLVFEGNAPAEVERNHLLASLLKAETWPARPKSFTAWVGDAIAIKDPTAAVFRPQSGSHLLMIGQQEDAALAMFVSSILSLAAQHRPDETKQHLSARFHILDGTANEDHSTSYLAQVIDSLPHPAQVLDPWTVAPTLTELAELIAARHARTVEDRTTHYLVIHGLQRFRDLRRPDDDYSFGRGSGPTPAQNFAAILRDGPAVGVHMLMWCDTLVNTTRALDRTMLRECTQRILFQMSATDSSHLIDSPLAARLGRNRALFHREEHEQAEKFRPYGLPSREWLAWAKAQLAKRASIPAANAGA